jgi:ArsR family transcriptional regulator
LRHASTFLQAVAHPIRLQILDALRAEPRTVGAIVERLGLEQPVVSRHLAILRKAAIVSVRPEGRERVYAIGDPRIYELLDILFTPNDQGQAA